MKFRRYSSIDNDYRDKTIHLIRTHGFADKEVMWVATEKIHGANFSIWYDGKEFQCGKRSGYIKEENFYNYHLIYEDLKSYAKTLWFQLTNYYGPLTSFCLYGELYGGSYPHPDVEQPNIKAIQSGVFYRPDVGFYAFDLVVDEKIMDYPLFRQYMRDSGIPYSAALIVGTFDEVIKYDNVFQSTISERLGLPLIENNEAEGYVMKPMINQFFGNDSRVILKSKNPKFSEKDQRNKAPKTPKEINPDVKVSFDTAVTFITENRLKNVLSQYGEVETFKEFGKVLAMLSLDVQNELYKGYRVDLDKADTKILNKLINGECANLIRPNFQNIIDGMF